jgi:O-antigen/teichoic acid export membrane protein
MTVRAQALRNTMFSSIGIYTEYFLGMLTSIFIARQLGPDDFGAYSAIIWLVAMGVAITNAGTASAVIKFIAELRGGGREELIAPTIRYLRRAQRWFLLAVVVAVAVLLLLSGQHIATGFDHLWIFGFLAAAIALRSQYMFNVGIAKGFENFRATAIVASVATPLNLGLVLLAWALDAEVEALLVVFLVSGVVFYVMSYRQVVHPIPAAPTDVVLPDVLLRRVRRHMRLVAVTVTIGFFAASEMEVFFLNAFGDSHGAGHFKVAYLLASGAAMLVPGVIGAMLLPMMANALSQGRDIAGRRFVASTTYLALLAAPLVAFGAVFCGPIIAFMYGAEYAPAAPVFAACLAACALATVSQSGSSLLISADRQITILILVVLCGVIKVVLDVVLIRGWGLGGATIAYVAASAFGAAANLILALRMIGMQPNWSRLLRILIAAAMTGAAILPLRGHWPPLPTLLVAGVFTVPIYALLTLLLRCWSSEDIEHLSQLHLRFTGGRPRALARLLAWSGRTVAREPS